MGSVYKIIFEFKKEDEEEYSKFSGFFDSEGVCYRKVKGSLSLEVVPIFPDTVAPALYENLCKKLVSHWFKESGVKTMYALRKAAISIAKSQIGKGCVWRITEEYLKKVEGKDSLPVEEEKIELTEDEKKPLGENELINTLGCTIKHDEENKLITFIIMLLTYTEDSQANVSFRAPSSTGKSYIPMEIAEYFPEKDIKRIGYSSPTAFFHDTGTWDPQLGGIRINLERKILIFLDQPHDQLLQRLRPLLSHDQKEILIKITDKAEKKGIRTKNVVLIGFPTVVFCTGNLRIDEQEATRNYVLSPETSQEKIRESIYLKAFKKSDPIKFRGALLQDINREKLRKRILAIRQEMISHIIVPDYEKIAKRFIGENKYLKPRHTRDISRLIALIQGHALLNLWSRDRDEENSIIATDEDVEFGFKLWGRVAESQELGLVPYIYRIFKEVIQPLAEANGGGLTRKDIISKHFGVYGRPLPDWLLRREILPALESCGLICLEVDPTDKRKTLIMVPVSTPPSSSQYPQNNRETQGGGSLSSYLDETQEPYPEGIEHPIVKADKNRNRGGDNG